MKKKLLSILLCAALVFAMAVPAFAAKPTTDIKNYSLTDGIQPSSTYRYTYQFRLKDTLLFLNVNNSAHPGTVQEGDAVILWNGVSTNDQQWYKTENYDGDGYFLRSALFMDYGMNINHVENKCTLIMHPQVNYYQGKSDSALYPPELNDTSTIVLVDWPYALTNSIAKAGYTSYWTSSGSQYSAG